MTGVCKNALGGAVAMIVCAAPSHAAENYAVGFQGAPEGMTEKLELVSVLARGERALPTRAAVRRVAAKDLDLIKNALKAAGYYGARVDYSIEGEDASKTDVLFSIMSGPAFSVTDYVIAYNDEGEDRPTSIAALNIEADGDPSGAALQKVQQAFLSALWNAGYPSASMVSRYAEADLATHTAKAVFTFESGPKARFGDIKLVGDLRTEPAYLTKLRTWEHGDAFDRSKLIAYRDRLAATGMFGAIDVAPGAPDENGVAPVIVTLQERKRRTIGAGVSFSTDEGPGGRLFFEYRNIFGAGESARVELEGNELSQAIQFRVEKPMPGFPGEIFGQFGFTNETTDAFNARTINIGAGVAKRWLNDRLTTRGGVAFETSKITEDAIEERTYFFSVPLSAVWDSETDPLALDDGLRAAFVLTPYTGSDTFTSAEFSTRSRISFGEEKRFTLAGRARLGATFGSTLSDLPLNKRFYAGGGSSVRGFAFQEAGPVDVDGDPIGGRSVIDGAIEARFKVTKSIQLAGFADAGNVSANTIPDFGGDYFVGVGGGVRYFTPIGPIRADFAIPLDRRETDAAFQLYISLGQPF